MKTGLEETIEEVKADRACLNAAAERARSRALVNYANQFNATKQNTLKLLGMAVQQCIYTIGYADMLINKHCGVSNRIVGWKNALADKWNEDDARILDTIQDMLGIQHLVYLNDALSRQRDLLTKRCAEVEETNWNDDIDSVSLSEVPHPDKLDEVKFEDALCHEEALLNASQALEEIERISGALAKIELHLSPFA